MPAQSCKLAGRTKQCTGWGRQPPQQQQTVHPLARTQGQRLAGASVSNHLASPGCLIMEQTSKHSQQTNAPRGRALTGASTSKGGGSLVRLSAQSDFWPLAGSFREAC